MAYSEEIKQKALEKMNNGEKIKDIAEEMGITVQTLYNWKRKAKKVDNKEDIIKEDAVKEDLKEEKKEETTDDKRAQYRKSLVVEVKEVPMEQKINRKRDKRIMLDYIKKFLTEERKRTYAKMQTKNAVIQERAIRNWDRIEILLDKISDKSEDIRYIEGIYSRIMDIQNQRGFEY